MNPYFTFITIYFWFSLFSGAQTFAQSDSVKNLTLSTILSKTVLFIYEDQGHLDATHVNVGPILGTAFVVGFPVPGDSTQNVPLVVTARHVVADRRSVLGRFNTKSGGAPIYITYQLDSLKMAGDLWEYPGDDGVDIIVFRSLVYGSVDFAQFPLNFIASKEAITREQIGAGDRIVIPCLMGNFPGIAKNYPIVRDGSIALIPEEPTEFSWKLGSREIHTSQPVIFVNSTINEGFSGAPVFLWPVPRLSAGGIVLGAKPWLLGIVHGFFPLKRQIVDDSGNTVFIIKQETGPLGLSVQKNINMYSQENSAVGVIFPSWKLIDIIRSDKVSKRINDILSQELKQKMQKR